MVKRPSNKHTYSLISSLSTVEFLLQNWFGEPNGPISSLVKRTKQSQVKKRTQDNIKCSRLFPWRAEKQSNEKKVLEIYVIHENSEKTN